MSILYIQKYKSNVILVSQIVTGLLPHAVAWLTLYKHVNKIHLFRHNFYEQIFTIRYESKSHVTPKLKSLVIGALAHWKVEVKLRAKWGGVCIPQ